MANVTHSEDFTGSAPAILVFGDLMKPKAFQNRAPRYKANLLYPLGHPDIGPLKEIILRLCGAAFPGRDPLSLSLPFKAGERLNAERVAKDKKPYSFYEGHFVLATQKPEKTQAGALLAPPRLVVMQNGEMVSYVDDDRPAAARFFYSGVKVVPIIQFVTFDGFGGGVTVYLQRLLSLGVGERIQTGPDDDAAFGGAERYESYMGAVSAEDPTTHAPSAASPW